jgi:hypothetical protein
MLLTFKSNLSAEIAVEPILFRGAVEELVPLGMETQESLW